MEKLIEQIKVKLNALQTQDMSRNEKARLEDYLEQVSDTLERLVEREKKSNV